MRTDLLSMVHCAVDECADNSHIAADYQKAMASLTAASIGGNGSGGSSSSSPTKSSRAGKAASQQTRSESRDAASFQRAVDRKLLFVVW